MISSSEAADTLNKGTLQVVQIHASGALLQSTWTPIETDIWPTESTSAVFAVVDT